ncbi:MAG TPA: LysR family transcriptional regulator [Pseudolabrys sp.]|jgi:LysR family nitrogen assimilation transcriptional regulator
MDLRILQAFIRVAELGSIARAAFVLNQTQPTISRQIAALERDLGGTLFVRNRRGMTLNPAGVQFRERAMQALRGLAQAKAEFTAQTQEPSGTISIGLPPSLRAVLSAPVLERFAKAHPRVLLHVYETIAQGLEELMRSGEADLAVLIADRKVLRNVALTPLALDPLLLAGPPGARLDPNKPLGIEALAGLPLLTYRPPNYLRLLTEAALRKRALAFNVAVEMETLPLMLELVERGVGYTLLPKSGVSPGSRIALAPLRGMAVTWTLAVNRERARRPAVRAFAEMIRAQSGALLAQGVWKPVSRRAAS